VCPAWVGAGGGHVATHGAPSGLQFRKNPRWSTREGKEAREGKEVREGEEVREDGDVRRR